MRRRCACGGGTLLQQQPTQLGELRGGGIGGYSRAPVVIGHRYRCEACGHGVWLASGAGAAINLFFALWLSAFVLFVDDNPLWLAITVGVFAALGAREAWLRHRHPKAL